MVNRVLKPTCEREMGSEHVPCAGVLSVDVCQLLQPVVEEMASDLCEVSCRAAVPSLTTCSAHTLPLQQPSSSEQSMRDKRLFCCFVGKLFLDSSYTRNRE